MNSTANNGNEAETATARAAEMVDHVGENVGMLAALLGHQARVFIARAREEAEDIWAEAQSLRQTGEKH